MPEFNVSIAVRPMVHGMPLREWLDHAINPNRQLDQNEAAQLMQYVIDNLTLDVSEPVKCTGDTTIHE